MADRFALVERAAGKGQGAGLAVDAADGATVRTGRVRAEGLGLLFEQGDESSFGQPCRGGASELLHGVEVGIQCGSVVAEGTPGDDFAPAGGEVADLLEELRGKLTRRHGESCLVLAEKTQE